MPARVFISYRARDGADKATALSRDLDALFGQDQIFLDKDDLPAGSRWRNEIARTLHAAPILLVLVTPNYLAARDAAGCRCIERPDDPVRGELADALASKAHIIPLLCDGVAQTPSAAELPAPFDELAERTWGRLRAYDWREDLARLAEDLRALGLVPRTTPAPLGSAPLPLEESASERASARAFTSRRVVLAGAGVLIVAAGVAFWRWQAAQSTSLAGPWRANIGRRNAPTSRDGEVVNVSIEQNGANLRLASSAVPIESDPDWRKARELWQARFGQPLDRVFYRGEGVLQSDDVTAPDAPPGPRRLLLSVHVDPAQGGAAIDTGALRGTVDPDGKRIRARVSLNGEQGERAVDLRRDP